MGVKIEFHGTLVAMNSLICGFHEFQNSLGTHEEWRTEVGKRGEQLGCITFPSISISKIAVQMSVELTSFNIDEDGRR